MIHKEIIGSIVSHLMPGTPDMAFKV